VEQITLQTKMRKLPVELCDQILEHVDHATRMSAAYAYDHVRISSQRLIFTDVYLTALHKPRDTGHKSAYGLFLKALKSAEQRCSVRLAKYVKSLHLTCEIDFYKEFEHKVVAKILKRLRRLKSLTVLIKFRPNMQRATDLNERVEAIHRMYAESNLDLL
jgi:hypothetical protein